MALGQECHGHGEEAGVGMGSQQGFSRVGAQVLGGTQGGMGQVYCQEPLVGTDRFSLVNDFIKLPAKYRLTSSQVITIMWEVTAQPSYRDCSGVHLPSTRAGQPLPLPAAVVASWEHSPIVTSSAQGDKAMLHQGHGADSQATPATTISPRGAREREGRRDTEQHILPGGPDHSPLPEGTEARAGLPLR